MKLRTQKYIMVFLSFAYVLWAGEFIYKSSFIAIDGARYFSLFDDAMISMRYAWHLSNGYGLVWNVGEIIEGMTNPLWTIWMSLGTLIFDKRIAVLFIHVSGVFIMLGIAVLTYAIASQLSNNKESPQKMLAPLISFSLVLLYYPLSFWTLLGMETGLLSLLLLFSIVILFKEGHDTTVSRLLLVFLGLSIWTRPDALIYVVPIMLYRFNELLTLRRNQQSLKENKNFRLVAIEIFILGVIVLLPVVVRWFYYGELVPNTYTLKMTGMAVVDRILNGIGFIAPFIVTIIPMLLLLLFDYKSFNSKRKNILLILVVMSIAYQVWVGGDPWPYWRMMAPLMPLLFILSVDSMFNMANKWIKVERADYRQLCIVISLSLPLIYLFPNYKFLPEQYFVKPALYVDSFPNYVNVALATNEILTKKATLAVFASGTTPYFSNLKTIDMLGKSDKKIARLSPDISGAIAWAGMRSVPGHNKYDLQYSIVDLQPTYVQSFQWGQDNLTDYAQQNYARVHYKGVGLWLLAKSKDVLWSKIEIYEHRPFVNPPVD